MSSKSASGCSLLTRMVMFSGTPPSVGAAGPPVASAMRRGDAEQCVSAFYASWLARCHFRLGRPSRHGGKTADEFPDLGAGKRFPPAVRFATKSSFGSCCFRDGERPSPAMETIRAALPVAGRSHHRARHAARSAVVPRHTTASVARRKQHGSTHSLRLRVTTRCASSFVPCPVPEIVDIYSA